MSDLALPIRSPPELALAGRFSSDERLARLISRGSARAFTVLYQRHHQALYRYCRSIVRDEDDAQDALQSAMMRALAALRAGERDLAVRPWLFRIVHNEAVSILRRRRPEVGLVEESEPSDITVERTSGSARAALDVGRRSQGAAGASACGAAHARAQWSADRADRGGVVCLAGSGEADAVRGAQFVARVRRGARHGV
jgi:RNA polymerase sigma factor (sigma-70 family)